MYVYDRPLFPDESTTEEERKDPFVGREFLLRSLLDGFHLRRSFLLCGGPKMGKTSLINRVLRQIYARWLSSSQAAKVVPVVIDLSQLTAPTADGLAALLYREICAAIAHPRVSGGFPSPTIRWKVKPGADPWKVLREQLQSRWKDLLGTPAWCTYGLIIEQGDRLAEPVLNEQLWNLSEFVNQDGDPDCSPGSTIFSCGRALRELLFDMDSPLKFARPLFLAPLNPAEASQLVRVGLGANRLGEEALQSLLITTGRHPYVLQRVCAELFLRDEDAAIEHAIEAAAPDILDLFAEIWEMFDLDRGVTYHGAYAAPEHALMQLLAESPQGCTVRSAEGELGITPLKEFGEFLEYVGVIERILVGNEQRLRAYFDLFLTWYADRTADSD